MNEKLFQDLEPIREALEKLNSSFTKNGISHQFLESVEASGGIFTLRGNSGGLIYLAKCCIELAQSQSEGKHYHFDEAHILDNAEKPFVVVFKSASWDGNG